MMWGYDATGGMAWWMILSSLFWLGLVAVAVWALVRWLSTTPRSTTPHEPRAPMSAMDILKARYARGEIDTATFQAMREELEASTAAPGRTPRAALPNGR